MMDSIGTRIEIQIVNGRVINAKTKSAISRMCYRSATRNHQYNNVAAQNVEKSEENSIIKLIFDRRSLPLPTLFQSAIHFLGDTVIRRIE